MSRRMAVWVVVVALAHGERRAAVASSTPARDIAVSSRTYERHATLAPSLPIHPHPRHAPTFKPAVGGKMA